MTFPSPAATPHNSSRRNNLHDTNSNESTNSVHPSAARTLVTLLLNKYLYGENQQAAAHSSSTGWPFFVNSKTKIKYTSRRL
jgi:hypothetical protein